MDKTNLFVIVDPDARSTYTIIGEDIEKIEATAGTILPDWLDKWEIPYEELPSSLFFDASAGTAVVDCTDLCEVYIANILPSTIVGVHAYRTVDSGRRILAPVPSRYYVKNESANLGTYDVTALSFPYPLEEIAGERWENQVYVSMASSVGPSVVDVIQWLIETYTDRSVNAANFATIKAQLQDLSNEEKYPVGFALLQRPNVLEELREICYEARLSLYFLNDEFYLKYLSDEPTAVATVTDSDILQNSLKVNYTSTESLVTRRKATYQKNYLPLQGDDRIPEFVIRHNIKKYGIQEQVRHYHIYNILELVKKSATFWAIRESNSYKTVSMELFHTNVALDVLDAINVDLTNDHFSKDGDSVLCFIESASWDAGTNRLIVNVNTGIRTGEDEQYEFFWPASMALLEWPTLEEIAEGNAGGYGPATGVTGTINDCPPTEEDL